MGVTRRTLLKTFVAGGVGAIAAPGAYGFLYSRHELELTRATMPVSDLPPALSSRNTSQN